LLEAIGALASLGSMLRLDASQCSGLMIGFGQSVVLVERLESTDGILIAVISSKLIPLSGFCQALFNVNSYFVVVAHGKFSSR
jgi:hypothetical protein